MVLSNNVRADNKHYGICVRSGVHPRSSCGSRIHHCTRQDWLQDCPGADPRKRCIEYDFSCAIDDLLCVTGSARCLAGRKLESWSSGIVERCFILSSYCIGSTETFSLRFCHRRRRDPWYVLSSRNVDLSNRDLNQRFPWVNNVSISIAPSILTVIIRKLTILRFCMNFKDELS